MGERSGTTWTVIVPFKGGPAAKSRLDDPDRGPLALAMARDTVAAALATGARILVVTSVDWPDEGAVVVPDPGSGLLGAVLAGLAVADGPTAVLLGDLPAVTPAELGSALTAAAQHERAFVADADGVGTALIAAHTPAAHRPAFGGGSAAAHRAAGYAELTGDWPGLRRDVDLRAHVSALTAPGRHTAAVLRGGLSG